MADSSTTTALAVFFVTDKKPLKWLGALSGVVNTQLKQGVNERVSQRPNTDTAMLPPCAQFNAKQICACFPSAAQKIAGCGLKHPANSTNETCIPTRKLRLRRSGRAR